MGFHADQEAARVLGNAMNHVRIGMAALHGDRVTITRSPIRPPQLVTPDPARVPPPGVATPVQ